MRQIGLVSTIYLDLSSTHFFHWQIFYVAFLQCHNFSLWHFFNANLFNATFIQCEFIQCSLLPPTFIQRNISSMLHCSFNVELYERQSATSFSNCFFSSLIAICRIVNLTEYAICWESADSNETEWKPKLKGCTWLVSHYIHILPCKCEIYHLCTSKVLSVWLAPTEKKL